MKISPKKYAQALSEVLQKSADPAQVIKNFLFCLCRRKQMKTLPKILSAFEEIWNHAHGIEKIEVEYPQKFESQLSEFEKKLLSASSKKAIFKTKASDALIGGFRLRSGDTLIDASIKGRLNALAQKLS